ncbi:MAG: Methyl-accepting chemotaxis protein I (serine chemoreceptor protein), partial [uncultured Chthoniobacterales bacterium]
DLLFATIRRGHHTEARRLHRLRWDEQLRPLGSVRSVRRRAHRRAQPRSASLLRAGDHRRRSEDLCLERGRGDQGALHDPHSAAARHHHHSGRRCASSLRGQPQDDGMADRSREEHTPHRCHLSRYLSAREHRTARWTERHDALAVRTRCRAYLSGVGRQQRSFVCKIRPVLHVWRRRCGHGDEPRSDRGRFRSEDGSRCGARAEHRSAPCRRRPADAAAATSSRTRRATGGVAFLDLEPVAPRSHHRGAGGSRMPLATTLLPAVQRDVQEHAGGIRRAAAYQRSASTSRSAVRERGKRRECGWLQKSGSLPACVRATPWVSPEPCPPGRRSETAAPV